MAQKVDVLGAGPLSRRANEVVQAAADLLEEVGRDGLTMRVLACRLGIKAPSLYKHLPDKAALESALAAAAFEELGTLLRARASENAGVGDLFEVCRTFAAQQPRLFCLMVQSPRPAGSLPAWLEDRAVAAFGKSIGDSDRGTLAWGLALSLGRMEVDGCIPQRISPEVAWSSARALFQQ